MAEILSILKINESGFIPLLCTYRLNWAWRTSWGWWDERDNTVLRHRIRISNPGDLRPSTLLLGHRSFPQYRVLRVDGEETFFSFKTQRPVNKPRTPSVKGSGANHYRALNFYLLEVVSRWRDPQLQVSENYSDLTKWRSTLFKSCWLMSHFIFNIFKMWYSMSE